MRPAGFEPATRGLEVRRFVYENAGSAACSSQIRAVQPRTCYPAIQSRCCLIRQQPTLGTWFGDPDDGTATNGSSVAAGILLLMNKNGNPGTLVSAHPGNTNAARHGAYSPRLIVPQFKRLFVRYDRRADIHLAFLALGCCLVCFRRLRSSF